MTSPDRQPAVYECTCGRRNLKSEASLKAHIRYGKRALPGWLHEEKPAPEVQS